MKHRQMGRTAAFAATLCCVTLGPTAAASASGKSIEALIASYGAKVEASETHVTTAVNEYKTSDDPTGVESAIGEAITVLGSLEVKVAHQSAGTPRVKKAKRRIMNGLESVIVGYRHLSSAYAEKAASPEAATLDASRAIALVKQGDKELQLGAKALH